MNLTPVARLNAYYDTGTPQAAVLAVVDSRYPESREAFFKDVAARCKITPDSAAGAFYGFLRGSRALPRHHRAVYLELLSISPEDLDAVAAEREGEVDQPRRGRLEELEAEVAELKRVIHAAGLAHDRLRGRVLAVERETGLRRPARQAAATNQRAGSKR